MRRDLTSTRLTIPSFRVVKYVSGKTHMSAAQTYFRQGVDSAPITNAFSVMQSLSPAHSLAATGDIVPGITPAVQAQLCADRFFAPDLYGRDNLPSIDSGACEQGNLPAPVVTSWSQLAFPQTLCKQYGLSQAACDMLYSGTEYDTPAPDPTLAARVCFNGCLSMCGQTPACQVACNSSCTGQTVDMPEAAGPVSLYY